MAKQKLNLSVTRKLLQCEAYLQQSTIDKLHSIFNKQNIHDEKKVTKVIYYPPIYSIFISLVP